MVLPKAAMRQSCAYTEKERNWKSDDDAQGWKTSLSEKERNWKSDDALGCKTCLSE